MRKMVLVFSFLVFLLSACGQKEVSTEITPESILKDFKREERQETIEKYENMGEIRLTKQKISEVDSDDNKAVFYANGKNSREGVLICYFSDDIGLYEFLDREVDIKGTFIWYDRKDEIVEFEKCSVTKTYDFEFFFTADEFSVMKQSEKNEMLDKWVVAEGEIKRSWLKYYLVDSEGNKVLQVNGFEVFKYNSKKVRIYGDFSDEANKNVDFELHLTRIEPIAE